MPKNSPSPTAIISLARACRLADLDYRVLCRAMAAGHFTPDYVTLGDQGRAYILFQPDRLHDLKAAAEKL